MSDELDQSLVPYVESARTLGVNVDDVYVMHQLIQAIRYVDARLKARHAGNKFMSDMQQSTGESYETLMMWSKSPYIGVASRIIGDKIIHELLEKDLRKNIVDVYSRDSLDWFKNMSRIAKGEKAAGARNPPLERDQIDAFEALTQSEMGQVFTRMLFLEHDDRDVTPEDLHIARLREMRGRAVKIESGIIEGEIREMANPETPAAALPSSG